MPTTKKTAREVAEEFENGRVIERPDGFYWQDKQGEAEYGPFRTRREAVEDMEFGAEAEAAGDSPLLEAESEIGIADWGFSSRAGQSPVGRPRAVRGDAVRAARAAVRPG